MIAAGVNAKALSTFMGHASVTITLDRYGHLFPGSEQEAAGLLDAYLERSVGGVPREGALHVRCTALHKRAFSGVRQGPTGLDASYRTAREIPANQAHFTEGEGFELSEDRNAHNGFRDRPVQPLRHPSKRWR